MTRTEEDMRLREKANIETNLKHTDWKIYGTSGAAELLGLKPTTLLSRIKKMGIQKVGGKDSLNLAHQMG